MARKPLKSVAKFRRPKSPEIPRPPNPTPPPGNNWKENWIVFGTLGTPVLMLVVLQFFLSIAKWRKDLDEQLSRWKTTYHLSDSVVSQLRQIELEFHGSGNPITTPIKHSALEIKEHHDGMALLMKKEDAAKFLRAYGSGRLGH
jgi:hypothetical protein